MKFGNAKITKVLFSWLPVLLIGFALLLRLWQNTVTPPSPYWEEVALGYDAYSILRTGHDHHGNFLPIVAFPSFGDYKPSLYFYSLVPSIALFGLNTFAVRLPAALFSSLSVGIVFWLLKRWTNLRIAFWSAFLLAIQPWAWQVGRVGFEVNLAVFLLLAGIATLDQSIVHFAQRNQRRTFLFWSLLAAVCFALSMYSYHGARVLAPLFGIATLIIGLDWQVLPKKPSKLFAWLPAIALGIFLLFPLLSSIMSPTVQQRFQETSLFTDPQPVLLSNHYRDLANNAWWSRIAYHRYVFWAEELTTNYLKHFSPSFLFIRGDENARHTSQYFGALYPWEALTLFVGLASGWKYFRQKKAYWLLVSLTLLSPVAAMITTATPHALRALPLASFLSAWSALGLVELSELLLQILARMKLLKRIMRTLPTLINGGIIVFCLISMGILWVYYHYQYRVEFANQWQYGYQELIQTLQQEAKPGEAIFVTREQGRPAMYLFFFQKIDPARVQRAQLGTAKDQQEFLEFENWHFIDGNNLEPGIHASSPSNTPAQTTNIRQIRDLKGNIIWNIYR